MAKSKKKGISAFEAGVVGAAVGAAAVFLSDKKTRDNLKKKGRQLLDEGEKKLEEAKVNVEKARVKSQDKLAKTLEEASDKIKTSKTNKK